MRRVPLPPGKSWIFFDNSRTGNHFGPGKSWKIASKVMHFQWFEWKYL